MIHYNLCKQSPTLYAKLPTSIFSIKYTCISKDFKNNSNEQPMIQNRFLELDIYDTQVEHGKFKCLFKIHYFDL